jgi:hypothetical protein
MARIWRTALSVTMGPGDDLFDGVHDPTADLQAFYSVLHAGARSLEVEMTEKQSTNFQQTC